MLISTDVNFIYVGDYFLVGKTSSGAKFSENNEYRYVLWRNFDDKSKLCTFIGLNPSTADETVDDPTIRRCINFAANFNCGKMAMINLFAYRSTSPEIMKSYHSPIGPKNDEWILKVASQSQIIVACWGNHGVFLEQDKHILQLLESYNIFCLDKNKSGTPKHPLYVKGGIKLVRFND